MNDNYVLKEIIEKHKHLLSLSDSKAKLANVKAILQYHNISIQSNMKTADLKELLLQHWNPISAVPITFVFDSSIDNYTEAPNKETSSLIQQQLTDFVHVTLVHDSVINLVKTQKDITESESKKWFDLAPVKHGYTPEQHPTKKQKAKKSMRNPPRQADITTWTDDSHALDKESKVKSFKEMINALQNTISSSDSKDDFDENFQLLGNPYLCFQKLDEPTEDEKQLMHSKFYMSDLFFTYHMIVNG